MWGPYVKRTWKSILVIKPFRLAALLFLAAARHLNGGEPLPAGLGAENIPIEFATENGWVHDGRIELPPEARRNGYAVMMLGGGLGSPIDWAVPGVMTLDGEPTRDADTIARALIDAGFIVMRWQAIRRGDVRYAEDPIMMEVPPFPQTVEQARKAYAAFREKKIVPEDRIFLLGHSLGARRAAILLEENPKTPGIVMLAGASLIPSDLEAARKIVAEAEKSPKASQDEKDTGREQRGDHNSKFEYVARVIDERRGEWFKAFAGTKDKHGFRWPADVIAEQKTLALLLVGELDERWLVESYMFTSYLRREGARDYTWKVFPGLGHQLAAEVSGPVEYKDQGVIANSRTGPIDPQVVKEIVKWLQQRIEAKE